MNDDARLKEIIDKLIAPYLDMDVADLKKMFDISESPKNINSILISKIIDIKNLDIDDALFLKKHTVFKTVRVKNNKIKESMSFPVIDYYDMYTNSWENSKRYDYFKNHTIVIFIFINRDESFILKGVKYLKLSEEELQQFGNVWNQVKELVVNNRLILGGKNGFSVLNFPSQSESKIAHVRPHDSNVSQGRALLPNGDRIINYCFWLNREFIESKISEIR